MKNNVTVIGAGLAGCEAAWQLAERGIGVTLIEMKPAKFTPAHHYTGFAELVCSNSLRSDRLENAVGLLKEELRKLGSLIMKCADETRIPAGGALAVDRTGFSDHVTEKIKNHPNITVVIKEVTEIPDGDVIIASGPLTSDALFSEIGKLTNEDNLYFYDAAAPIVTLESVDFDSAYRLSRYGKGDDDYINCPMTEEEYTAFYNELIKAECTEIKGADKEVVFEGCMPVETMAKRGENTLLFGPLKPVGLPDPKTGKEPYAVVQLRQDNKEGTLYNIVGFQTHLKWGEQKRVFGMIPALKNAEFVRYGVMHRNTFINSPKLLDCFYNLKSEKRIYFAGQITGVEGYVESTSSGFVAGLSLAKKLLGEEPAEFPDTTAIGALSHYVSGGAAASFQPMNVNFGIMAPLGEKIRKKQEKNLKIAERALRVIDSFV
ncbi:MAG: methylenetetrahydrofolate--tRNA-(uracil(54)-C(5))-methyltransferase (FADH(2)-oxidizing) TrmFO [Clostridia bacterium]|nr:methylenetetrahydrofolate--tRNA-(uracil(54)-C(5))-methyltransferase (FADH(2)-oxidizing) TrmFO [Clostridia bacterium]